jgi:membrane associated rhomboid family serine protease
MRVTLVLIGLNVIVFVLELLFGSVFIKNFSLISANALTGSYWQFLTYMFLHADTRHIAFNMFALLIFGVPVERHIGERKYILLYLFSGVASSFFHIFLTGVSNIPMLGASGAVFGVLTAYGVLFPRRWVFIPPGLPLPSILAVAVFAVMQFFLGIFNLEEGVANFGHLGGIVAGLIFMLILKCIERRKKHEEPQIREFEFIWE